jgi:FkbM family methyltransferase
VGYSPAMSFRRRVHVLVSSHRHSRFVIVGESLAGFVRRAVGNDDANGESNGEYEIIRRLPRLAMAVDVGANAGTWTGAVRRMHPTSKIVAFEIHPEMARELRDAFGPDPNVTVYAVGLSDREADVEIVFDPASSHTTSLVAIERKPHLQRVSARVDRLDNVLKDIDHVDFLKVDAEGHDFEVIRGARGLLERGIVDVVQFEFTLWAAIAHRWLSEFYDELESVGFVVGKLFPDGVDFRPYRPEMEEFLRCNFVAVKSSRQDLVTALAVRPSDRRLLRSRDRRQAERRRRE